MTNKEMSRSAFSLLELMVVLVILSFSVGFVTLNVSDLSQSGRLRSAAAEMGAAYRMGLLKASRSGLPCLVEFDPGGCVLRSPVIEDGEWQWRTIADFRLANRVRIDCVSVVSTEHCETQDSPPWKIPLNRGKVNQSCFITLTARSGMRANVIVDSITGFEQLELVEDTN